MPELAIILVNYKRAHDTVECVRSLRLSSFTDFEIVVVDNASGDGSVELLRTMCPEATVIANTVNLGFAGGNNVGIREALHRDSRGILLLNNDTIVDRGALAALRETLHARPDTGVVGGKIYYFDQPTVLWFAGGFFNDHSGFGGHYGMGEQDHGQYDHSHTCDYVTGCCMLCRREVLEKVGLLEDSYFAYLEDADFCTRVRRAGYTILYQPKAVIHHKISSTSSWDSAVYIYFNLRNKILFLRRNSSMPKWLPSLPRLVYFYARQFVRLIFKWGDVPRTRAAWFGLVDGLRNYTGVHGEGRLNELLQS